MERLSSIFLLCYCYCYSSSPIFKFGVSSIVGLAVGCISPQATNFAFFSQVFCNNQTNNSFPLIGKGSFSNLSTIESLSCSELYSKAISSFSNKIWGGNRLLIEPHYSYGFCNCLSGCPTNIPTTFTQKPTSLLPTSFPTFSSFKCFNQVANCHLCPQYAPLFDLTQGNVSCVFFQNEWRWTFIPNNETLTNTGEIV